MFQVKQIFLPVILLVVSLSSCVPAAQQAPAPALTLAQGTDVPQQAATTTPDIITQTPDPVMSTVVPDAVIPSPHPGGLKPPDSDMPAAGICGNGQGDPATIVLGTDASGLPLAGRCLTIDPEQRIKLVNQSDGRVNTIFAGYQIDLSAGDEMLLDKPVGQYLASGVHSLPVGPQLWVKPAVVVTAPPPIVQYDNSVVGYRLGLPGDWFIDENGMTNSLYKELYFRQF